MANDCIEMNKRFTDYCLHHKREVIDLKKVRVLTIDELGTLCKGDLDYLSIVL